MNKKTGNNTYDDDSKMLMYLNDNVRKIPTHIRVLDKASGNVEVLHNEIIWGGRLSIISGLAKSVVLPIDKHYTINDVIGSNTGVVLTNADWVNREVVLFGGGNEGVDVGGSIIKPHPDQVVQNGAIPIRCRPTDSDLAPEIQAKYGLRCIKTFKVNGIDTDFICYYGKKPESVTIITTRNGEDYSPHDADINQANVFTGDGYPIISTTIAAVFELDLVQEDFYEYFNATNNLTDDSGFSEISMISGIEKDITSGPHLVQPYKDYVGCEYVTALTMSKRPTDAISRGYGIKYSTGG